MPDAPSTDGHPPPDLDGVRADPYLNRVLDGRYAVRELLAVSAMSRVYKVVQLRSGIPYALKILAARPTSGDPTQRLQARQRFEREATTLARLTHPNIVGLVDYGVVGDCPYMVMQFLEGETLLQVLRRRALGVREALRVVDHLGQALAAAHREGVIHRDIKPSNVFLNRPDADDATVLLFDFGIAKEQDDSAELTGVDAVVGTVWYMAPEQALGDPIDPRTDLYAMGVLLFRLLAGRTPFAHHRGVSVLVAHINEAPPTLADIEGAQPVPPVVEWTLARCLEKDPGARFRSVHELRKALAVCRLALDHPELDTRLELHDGRVEASEAVAERLHGTELLTRQVPPVDLLGLPERTLIAIGATFIVLGLISAAGLAAFLALSPPP